MLLKFSSQKIIFPPTACELDKASNAFVNSFNNWNIFS